MGLRGLIAVLLLSWMGQDEQYYGTRAASIAISENAPANLIESIPLKPGDTITLENVRASIQTLHDTGLFTQIDVEATNAGNGTHLIFRVQHPYFFSTFRLEPEDLLDRSISSFFRLPLGERFSALAVDRLAQDTAGLLRSEGYFEAQVTPAARFDEETRLAEVTLNSTSGPRAKVGMIRIRGGEQTFSQEELQDAFGLRPESLFSARRLESAVASLRSQFTRLGFLNTGIEVDRRYDVSTGAVDLDVSIDPGTFTLVQTRGYDVSRSRLRELVPIFEEGAIDADLVEEGRVEIGRFLQQEGYFEATVRAEIIEAPLDNATQIIYVIEPGDRHRIRQVRIEGNQYFGEKEIKARMQVQSAGLLSRGRFSTSLLEQDVRTIESMYRNAGFDGTGVHGRFEEEMHTIDVVIEIQEGRQYPIAFVGFEGNGSLPDAELRSRLHLTEGQVYTQRAGAEARNILTSVYYAMGYPNVRIDPVVERVPEGQGLAIVFRIDEGEYSEIGEILVAGNRITQEKIIHRHSTIYPSTPFNPEAVLEAQQRLYATGLFARVDIVALEQNLPGIRNMLIQVEEANRLLVTYGFGYQEFEGPRGTVDVTQTNLWGQDRAISFRVRGSRREQRFQTTYREPQLFNRGLDGFASLFLERIERPAFDASRVDLSFQTLKRFSRQQSFLFTTSYQTVNLRDVRDNRQAIRVPEETGTIQIARIAASLIGDRRDDPINPRTGSFTTVTLQTATRLLGSEVNFVSLFNQSNYYRPMGTGVLATSIRAGWNRPFGGTERMPISERFFAGGSTTLRGFDLDEAGPAVGGNAMTIANMEYRIPLARLPIRGIGAAFFYDTGNVFESLAHVRLKNFTHTAGFGLRYQTPLGPVRLDFGFNLKPKLLPTGDREDRSQIFFTLGHAF